MTLRKRTRARAAFPESMLDLIWILLFYFLMISTVRTTKSEETVLIQRVPFFGDSSQMETQRRRAVRITIAETGKVLLRTEEVSPSALHDELVSLSEQQDEIVLIVDVDRNARVEDLLYVEDSARAAGLRFLIQRNQSGESATAPSR